MEKFFDVRCIGISADEERELFQPFSQVDNSLTRKHAGNGLGLAISRQLARILGGDVTMVESRPSAGSVFKIEIEATIVMTANAVTASSVTAKPNMADRLNGLRILIAEDVRDLKTVIATYLRTEGAEVETVGNGKQAVNIVNRNQRSSYDLILMDLQMPIMDGYSAMKQLREMNYRGAIIAVTAHAMKSEQEKCLSTGFDGHITKPIESEHLVETIPEVRRRCAQ